jgi:hypothetical protein
VCALTFLVTQGTVFLEKVIVIQLVKVPPFHRIWVCYCVDKRPTMDLFSIRWHTSFHGGLWIFTYNTWTGPTFLICFSKLVGLILTLDWNIIFQEVCLSEHVTNSGLKSDPVEQNGATLPTFLLDPISWLGISFYDRSL